MLNQVFSGYGSSLQHEEVKKAETSLTKGYVGWCRNNIDSHTVHDSTNSKREPESKIRPNSTRWQTK